MKKRTIVFGVIILLIIALEVFIRLCYKEELTTGKFAHKVPLCHQPDSVLNYTYIPSSEYVYPPTGHRFRFNSLGLHGEDFPGKSDDRFRIVVIGDSFAAGHLSAPGFTNYVSELQSKFRNEGYDVDVLNCSIDGGHRSYVHYKTVNHLAVGLDPDLILLQYSLPLETDNLARESYRGYRMVYTNGKDSLRQIEMKMIDDLKKYEGLLDVLYHSYITKMFFKLVLKYRWNEKLLETARMYMRGEIIRKSTNSSTKFTMEESIDMIKALQQELRNKDMTLFLYTVENNDEAFSTAKEFRIPLIRLNVSDVLTDEDRLVNDPHLNKAGSEKIADRFFELLTRNKVVPPEFCKMEREGN